MVTSEENNKKRGKDKGKDPGNTKWSGLLAYILMHGINAKEVKNVLQGCL
jgi:hypothetical protein